MVNDTLHEDLGGTNMPTQWESTSVRFNATFKEIAKRVKSNKMRTDGLIKTAKELTKIDATTTSSTVALQYITETYKLILINEGEYTIYVTFGSSATTNSFPIFPGKNLVLDNFNSGVNFAAITKSGASTLRILGLNGAESAQKTNFEILNISASNSGSQSATFADTTSVKDIIIANSGVYDAKIDLDGSATVTGGILLEPNDYFILNEIDIHTYSAITEDGDTDIIILGVY